ncbi:MAG: GntR family transcriptional regulator [Pseudomonadota bacterium]
MNRSSDRAYTHVKDAILTGQHRSGQRLPEDQIAAQLGVSRTPVRDALRRLEAEGFVEHMPHSGARVSAWSAGELAELAAMRALLEGYAASLAAQKISNARLDDLRRSCDAMEESAADPLTVTLENLRFHRLVAEAAANGRLLASLEPLWPVPLLVRKFSLFDPTRIAASVTHHREIVEALTARDSVWASASMRAHLAAARSFDPLLASAGAD